MDPLADEIRSELARFGPQAGMAELVERWPDAVGPAIARNAWPARIAKDGTVNVNTADSVWAYELGQRGAEKRKICERVYSRGHRFQEESPVHRNSPWQLIVDSSQLAVPDKRGIATGCGDS